MGNKYDIDIVKDIQKDIVANYKEHLNPSTERPVPAYRYLFFGNVYDGKYRAGLLQSQGYAAEYAKSKPFLTLINRLALTHTDLFNKFTEAWEKNYGIHVSVLLSIFKGINDTSYKDLNAYVQTEIESCAQTVAATPPEKDKITEFIRRIIFYRPNVPQDDPKYDDYFEIKKYINYLLKNDKQLARLITTKDILRIKKLREDLKEKEQELDNKVKALKVTINQYLLSLNEDKLIVTARISRNKKATAFSIKYNDQGKLTQGLLDKKRQIKQQKAINNQIAETVGTNLGVGEGTVAGVAMYTFLAATIALPAAIGLGIATGIAGFICNYYLVRDDTYGILKEILIKKFFSTLTGVKRDAALVLGSASLATGFVYGALSAMKLYNGLLIPLFAAMQMPHAIATIVATTAACFPVGFTAIGIASIFFFVIADFIKNERWNAITSYWYRNYVDLGWSKMTKWEFFKTSVKCLGKVFKLALGLAINILITVISFGVFHSQGVKLLSLFVNGGLASSLSSALTATNAVIATFFGIEKVNMFLEGYTLGGVLKTLVLFIPYYLPKLILDVISFTLDSLCKIPIAAVYLLGSIPTLLVNAIGYSLQLIIGSINAIFSLILDTPKNLVNLVPAILAVSLYIVSGLIELVRAPISLACRLIEWGFTKLSGISLDVPHQIVDAFFTKISCGLQQLASTLFEFVSYINKSFDLTTIKHFIQGTLHSAINGITYARRAITAKVAEFKYFVLTYATQFYNALTAYQVCKTIFNTIIFPIKQKFDIATGAEYKKLEDKEDQELNRVQKAVRSTGKDLTNVVVGCAAINGLGQSALMANPVGPVPGVVSAGCEFPYSFAPNEIAAKATFSRLFQVNPSKVTQEKNDKGDMIEMHMLPQNCGG